MSILRGKARSFNSDTAGAAGIMFAAALPVLVGFAAFAVDVGHVYLREAKLQILTDEVALAALVAVRENRLSSTKSIRAAQLKKTLVKFSKENMPEDANSRVITGEDIEFGTWDFATSTFSPENSLFRANAVRVNGYMNPSRDNPVPTFFGGIFADHFNVSTSSIAVLPTPPSFHVLSETESAAFYVENSDIDVLDTVVNSDAREAVVTKGTTGGYTDPETGNFVSEDLEFGGFVQVAGEHKALGALPKGGKRITEDLPGMADFLQYEPEPRARNGCGNARNLSPAPVNDKIILKPGTYCGLVLDTPAKEVVFEKGVYVFKDGPLIIQGQERVIGDRVLFYFTGENANLRIEQSDVYLRARRTGEGAGITIMSDRTDGDAPSGHLIQEATLYSGGIVYAPNSPLRVLNGRLDGYCKIVCLVSETLNFTNTQVNYTKHDTPPTGLRWSSSDIPNPVGLETTFRPYVVDF